MTSSQEVSVNQRTYRIPQHPTVVVCVDGCESDYIGLAVAAGAMPWLGATLHSGFSCIAQSAMPSFTNPNNLSIVTGVPPAVHGICGNYLLDPVSHQEVMMNDPTWLRAPTLLAALARAGKSVAVITAKDKLRALLGHGLRGICFSAEKADQAQPASHGIGNVLQWLQRPLPDVYSAELSEFVMAAGVQLVQEQRAEVLYLSTTDYIQHKHAPGTPEANDFYRMLDRNLAQLDALGCVIAITADHGMNSKIGLDGRPHVLYLQDWCDLTLGAGKAQVILPITDPYVAHHGALGSYATVYLKPKVDAPAVCAQLSRHSAVAMALPRMQAVERFELPADRVGDIVVVAQRSAVLGTSQSRHDLTALDAPLRSHGGTSEQDVPLIVNRPVRGLHPERKLRNFDAFDLALNYAQ
jgi:phosphonoacetate hydrolase